MEGWHARVSRWTQPLRARIQSATANADWQARASVHPLGRWVARRQARALFDLCSGFCYSQILVSCEALGLFEPDCPFPLSAAELSATHDPVLSADRVTALLDGAVALGLLEAAGQGRYRRGSAGAALAGNPGVRAMVRHNQYLYRDLAQPLMLLGPSPADSALRRYWSYAGRGPGDEASAEEVLTYSRLMAESQRFIVDQVLAAVEFAPYRHLMDLGGGTGAFLRQVGQQHPHLKLTLLDLPAVIDQARAVQAELPGPVPAIELCPGDLFGPLPAIEADLVTLVRVLHDHDEPAVRSLLQELRRQMRPGATLMIAEPLAGRRGGEGSQAYFATYFLAMGQGQLRTRGALEGLLRDTGFELGKSPVTPVPMLVEVLVARA
jgi:demethylspheroidene O-methyltransferase